MSQLRLRSFCSVTARIAGTRGKTELGRENWEIVERTPSLGRATRAWIVLAKLPGAPNSLCAVRGKPQMNDMHPGALSHANVTAARLSDDLLAYKIASPGSSGRQRRGQVSGRLAP
jgi:hypothetical protein